MEKRISDHLWEKQWLVGVTVNLRPPLSFLSPLLLCYVLCHSLRKIQLLLSGFSPSPLLFLWDFRRNVSFRVLCLLGFYLQARFLSITLCFFNVISLWNILVLRILQLNSCNSFISCCVIYSIFFSNALLFSFFVFGSPAQFSYNVC